MQFRRKRFSWVGKNWSIAIKHYGQMKSFEDNRWRLEWREDEGVEYILRDLVVQVLLHRDGDELFKYSSGVD
jgi:hypothetical protein